MSQALILSTLKFLLENFTELSNHRNEGITVSLGNNVGDEIIHIEPSPLGFRSNRMVWFYKYPFDVIFDVKLGDTEVKIKPAQARLLEGDIAYPKSNTVINDYSILDGTRTNAPYCIINSAERATSTRTGYVLNTFSIPIEPHVMWEYQDVALAKLALLIDEILTMLDSKLLYPVLPAIKYLNFFVEDPPFFREHPDTPEDAIGVPFYAGQKVLLSFEDYEPSYEELDIRAFFNQFID